MGAVLVEAKDAEAVAVVEVAEAVVVVKVIQMALVKAMAMIHGVTQMETQTMMTEDGVVDQVMILEAVVTILVVAVEEEEAVGVVEEGVVVEVAVETEMMKMVADGVVEEVGEMKEEGEVVVEVVGVEEEALVDLGVEMAEKKNLVKYMSLQNPLKIRMKCSQLPSHLESILISLIIFQLK